MEVGKETIHDRSDWKVICVINQSSHYVWALRTVVKLLSSINDLHTSFFWDRVTFISINEILTGFAKQFQLIFRLYKSGHPSVISYSTHGADITWLSLLPLRQADAVARLSKLRWSTWMWIAQFPLTVWLYPDQQAQTNLHSLWSFYRSGLFLCFVLCCDIVTNCFHH